MADYSKSKGQKSLAGWTMVDSKGEVMSEDSRSESSESSVEVSNVSMEDSGGDLMAGLLDSHQPFITQCQMEEQSEEGSHGNVAHDTHSFVCGDEDENEKDGVLEMFSETLVKVVYSPPDGLIEKDGGVGACCEALMDNQNSVEDQSDVKELYEDVEDENDVISSSDADPPSREFLDEVGIQHKEIENSDSDSDFVQLNDDNLEEFEAEIERNRNDVPDRSPSIAEGFNFLGPYVGALGDENPERVFDEDHEYENFNEDTESSAEDVADDRIESDQSEVGSVNTLTDVGDLSAFADIGDLPIVAGDVARNYRHRPNNYLSKVLNIVLVIVTVLTMGISIGLIMATDQEMEEWQSAYLVQAKKVSSLEWTLSDMNRSLNEAKDKVNAHDALLKIFSKSVSQNENVHKFFDRFPHIVDSFAACTKKHGSLSTVECHALVLPSVQLMLSFFKDAEQRDDEFGSSYSTIEKNFQLKNEEVKLSPFDKQGLEDLEQTKQSLVREQERALHWQNLYLLERRQREWERDYEYLEDKRDRAQWEKEDEEEDRREREQWVKKDEEEDRRERERWQREDEEEDKRERERWEREDEEEDRQERERWEREERENDRKDRMLWEQQEAEEDRRDRERWEKERKEVDSLECLKRLMSTNLTVLRQHILQWNATAFDDFVNMSSLMAGIAELKHSVLVSVQQIWDEAEQALNKMGEDVKQGRKSYLDTSIMADYLQQALLILKSQFNDVVNLKDDFSSQSGKQNQNEAKQSQKEKSEMKDEKDKSRNNYESSKSDGSFKKDQREGKHIYMWNKIGKMFKKTSKSLRKFVRTVTTSWTHVKDFWEKKALKPESSHEYQKEQRDNADPLPPWLPGKACGIVLQYTSLNDEGSIVEIGSPCMWDVREGWASLMLKEPCVSQNRYSLGCNVDGDTVWRLKRDTKNILEADETWQNIYMNKKEGREVLNLFEQFWKNWGNNELLLKSDNEWAYCKLRYWSSSVVPKNDESSSSYRSDKCSRLVNLNDILLEIETRIAQYNGKSEQKEEDIQPNVNGDETEVNVNDQAMHSDSDQEEFDEGTGYYEYDDNDDDFDHLDNNDNDMYTNVLKEDKLDEKFFLSAPNGNPAGFDKNNNSHIGEEMSEEEYFELMAWYLKRAQHRIEMRRAQEKNLWFFDMSHHRKEMRQEHNAESGQWLFDQAKDRDLQRKKSQESDWLFERAKHRRQEFAKKWKHRPHEFQKHDNIHQASAESERQKKMKDLSDSDWLLHKEDQSHNKAKIKVKKYGKGKKINPESGSHEQKKDKKGFKNSDKKGKRHAFDKDKKGEKRNAENYLKHEQTKKQFRQRYGKKATKNKKMA